LECQPAPDADYVLCFSRGETVADIRKASAIVAGVYPMFVDDVDLRRVERRTKDQYQEWRKATP
jgi:hypothetical protein